MEHGLKQISFYVQKRIVAMARCYVPALVHDKPLGSPASVKRVYYTGRANKISFRKMSLKITLVKIIRH